jgi:hypothetical protein
MNRAALYVYARFFSTVVSDKVYLIRMELEQDRSVFRSGQVALRFVTSIQTAGSET